MKKIILIAGKDRHRVFMMRRYLRNMGYDSIPCISINKLMEELNVLPTCGFHISQVIIEPDLLPIIDTDLVNQLCNYFPEVPFVFTDSDDLDAQSQEFVQKMRAKRKTIDSKEIITGKFC